MNDIVAAHADTAIHVILDNLNTHKPRNDRWLRRHPNVHFHFTPTRASWLNQVEIWFSILQGQSLHGASFTSVKQLREHIDAFIKAYNTTAAPFAWTKSEVHQKRLKPRFAKQQFRVLGVVNGGGVQLGCVRALLPRDNLVSDREAPAQPSWSTVEVQVVARPQDTHQSRRRARPEVRASDRSLGPSGGKTNPGPP